MSCHRHLPTDRFLFWISALTLSLVAALFFLAHRAFGHEHVPPADVALTQIEAVLLAEAASEGLEGMTWVACTMRERRWTLDGYAGSRRRDLAAFVRRQPRHARLAAAAARRAAAAGFDCGGATHFENVATFGDPPWAADMSVVATVGRHRFYRAR